MLCEFAVYPRFSVVGSKEKLHWKQHEIGGSNGGDKARFDITERFGTWTGSVSHAIARSTNSLYAPYGIFTNIGPKNHQNLGKYTIHGAYLCCFCKVEFHEFVYTDLLMDGSSKLSCSIPAAVPGGFRVPLFPWKETLFGLRVDSLGGSLMPSYPVVRARGVHIPYTFPIQWGAVLSYLEFHRHLIVSAMWFLGADVQKKSTASRQVPGPSLFVFISSKQNDRQGE